MAIERIRTELSRYPGIRFDARPDRIEVHPANSAGFIVGLHVHARGFTVYFEGWHEEFISEDDAVKCFMFGLSSRCRLAVVLRGQFPVKWTVEHFEDGRWMSDSETGLLFQPFWRRRRIEYRQNFLMPDASRI